MRSFIVAMSLILSTLSGYADDDQVEREKYLAKRAAEKAAAEKAVEELSVQDQGTLSHDDNIRLSLAYNELGDNRLALEAICRVPDEVLAEKRQLTNKAICFQNMSHEDASVRIRALAFIDRCLDKKYGNSGVWLWRKAKVICQSSIAAAIPTRGDEIGSEAHIIDHEQYEYAFELLQKAFDAEPTLYHLEGAGHQFMWEQDFPLLSKEPRFADLMKKQAAK